MKQLVSIFLTLLLGVVFCASALEVEPNYYKYLQSAPDKEVISVIIILHSPRDIRALDQELHLKKASFAERHRVVMNALESNAKETQGPIIEQLDAWKSEGKVVGYTAFWIENLIVVQGNAEILRQLMDDPTVKSIEPNFKAELIEPVSRGPLRPVYPNALDNETTTVGQDATGATRVNRELGISGEGVLVANCDTGVDSNHPALRTHFRGRTGSGVPMSQCWRDELGTHPNAPADDNGHGSHVMGTICGREIQQDGDTITVGAAPNAEFICTNPIGQGTGGGFDNDVVDAYQWLTDPDGDSTSTDDVPDVVQNSWGVNGSFPGYSQCFSFWNTVVLNCEAGGTVITWSAGNEGPGAGTLRTPAIFAFSPTQIFSVGAVDVTNHPNPPYPIADFSSRGPSECDPDPQAIKPEISAPGVDVYSVQANSQGYVQNGWSGTSMAGPHVAGVVALMREACPNCDPQTIKEALLSTATDQGPAGDDNTFGMGFLNAYDAVIAVSNVGRISGTVTDINGQPVGAARVQLVNENPFAITNGSGQYALAAQDGLHSLRFTKYGWITLVRDSIQATEGDTTILDVTMAQAPQGVLAGLVQIQTGQPIPNAEVWLVNTPVDTMITNAQGRFVTSLPATSYQVHVRMTYMINANPVTFNLDTTVDVNVGDTTHIVLTIRVPQLDPVGPDTYGYMAYDRYDRDLPAPREWVEIASYAPFNGHGVSFRYAQQDSSVFFRAPFLLKFYGQNYDSLTVNCNGWMAPGVQHGSYSTNGHLPVQTGESSPAGIIAPYWDDFRNGLSAERWQWYDEANGRWIFEFTTEQLVANSNYLFDWEVFILDPSIHATRTGDCEIQFNYRRCPFIQNCTVGIENPARTTGLQLMYNSTPNAATYPIGDSSSIRITTGLPNQFGAVNGTLTLYPASNNITSAVITIGGRTASPNANGQFTVTQVPVGTMTAVLTLQGYEPSRVGQITVTPGGTASTAMDAWRLDPPRSLTGSQFNAVATLSWTRPLSLEQYPATWVHYSLLRNDSLRFQDLADTFAVDTLGTMPQATYRVIAQYRHGVSLPSDTFQVIVDLSASDPNSLLPAEFALEQNYPNPFNPDTRIRLALPENSVGQLKIYDITGRLVRTLVNGPLTAGYHDFVWDSRDNNGQQVSTGMYFYRFASDKYSNARKMMLVK